MRVAVLYDIHGNLPALEAVLADVRSARVDRVVVGGDVFPGPMPLETLARLYDLKVPAYFIRGNGDREVLAQMQGTETPWYRDARAAWRAPVRWTARQLPSGYAPLISRWHDTCTFDVPGIGAVLFCHATPRSDTEIFTRRTPEDRVRPALAGVEASLVVCGHTHMTFDRTIGDTRVVNAGSVGMPFGRSGADWLLLGPDVELRHTDYDLEAAAARIAATDYPDAAAFAADHVLTPPSEASMLDRLEPHEFS